MNKISVKELLKQGPLTVPGVWDALSAKLAEQAGFQAAFLTGYGVSAAHLGLPDLGLIHGSEIARVVSAITNACDIALIADADTGYGGPLNVMQTVRLYERAGAAGIQLEDQQWPKRCGHIEGKQVISVEEMTAKLRAAADARECTDTLLIARTDAIAVEGFSSALSRCEAYLEAGADCLFVEAPGDQKQVEDIPKLLPAGHIINLAETGKTPAFSAQEVFGMGYQIALFPITGLLSSAKAMQDAFVALKNPAVSPFPARMTYDAFNDAIGMTRLKHTDRLYLEQAGTCATVKGGER